MRVRSALEAQRILIEEYLGLWENPEIMNQEELIYYHYLKSLPDDLLATDEFSLDEKKIMFKRMVQSVELEVNTFCNRKCSFCANSFLDRFEKKDAMSWETYQLIISELKSVDYGGALVFARYSEPLASPEILKYLAFARKELPSAHLRVLSNGDYLTRDYLESLSEAGVDLLSISLYPNMQNWDSKVSRRAVEAYSKKLELETIPTEENENTFRVGAKFKKIDVSIKATNLLKVGTDRASSLPELIPSDFVRSSPCFLPAFHVNIDQNGKVLLCCNTRSDDPNHQDFVFGELKEENDLFHCFFNSHFLKWRRILLNADKKPYPCNTCTQRDRFSSDLYKKVGDLMALKFSAAKKKQS